MPKKKKSSKSRKKAAPVEVAVPSPFVGYSIGVVLILIALFILIGGFGTGGSLPVDLFHGGYWLLGWAAFSLPIALVFFGVYKFMAEDHKIPTAKFISMILAVFFLSCLLYTMFATKNQFGVLSGGHGGTFGKLIGGGFLDILDKIPAAILFFVATLMAAFSAFGVSPSVILSIGKVFRTKLDEEGSELANLKAKSDQGGFKLNEGVPVEHHDGAQAKTDTPQPRLSSLKNTAQKLSAGENHEALTTASDPDWKYPSVNLLNQKLDKADAGDVNGNARIIHDTFSNFKIEVEMEGANIGPTVTQYTLKPPADVKLTKITALENNLALDLAAHSIRMEAPIPGKRAVGIEVPNVKAATVRVSSLISSNEWAEAKSPLTFTIGKDITGKAVVADLAAMPHLLIAGQTGAGKSVMINTLITSLLYRNSPADLKLILVDPKQVELGSYNELPHLLSPVINEPEKCISALKWAVAEMDRRLKAMALVGKRNITEYNSVNESEGMPYIVIVIDELADLMMMAARDVEALIVRLAQKARAAGIHLVLATQRPSVDVITGLIKANVPARIAFTVASQIDSRTIIDQMGAEKLLGRGDMLLLTSDMPKPKRVQAAFIEHGEITKVNDFIKMQRPPQYNDEVVSQPVQLSGKGGIISEAGGGSDADDNLWRDAVNVVIENRKASTSLLQRRLRIGYGRAARLIETMEEQGIIGAADGSRPREVLVSSIDEVYGGASPGGDYDESEESSNPDF
ncbi:MAG TPA: DNA translocase FtsK 4TM domain-containing protein [Candidatus Saccharimonadales bacterium]